MLVCAIVNGCSSTASHIYQGRLYSEASDCLYSTSTVDIVVGSDPGFCSPTCVTIPTDRGRAAYLGLSCAPYPVFADVTDTDPVCLKLKAAAARSSSCFADGGASNPADAQVDPQP